MSRYSIILSEKLEKMLEGLSGKSESSKANTIRNAIYVFNLLMTETKDTDKQVAIVDSNNKIEKIIILPQ